MHAPPTRVLMVCLGNICRSPMAEGILRQRAAEAGLNIEVDSAGTADYHVGEAPDRRAQQALAEQGMDISGLRGRQLKAADFDTFDHILVMDRSNLRNTLALAPHRGPTPEGAPAAARCQRGARPILWRDGWVQGAVPHAR